MKRLSLVTILAASGLLLAFGCVLRTEHVIHATVDVNIRHIEEEADDVLDFIEGESSASRDGAEDEGSVRGWMHCIVDALSPIKVAYAAEPELKNVSSDAVKELAQKMKDRFPKIDTLKKAKCLGEDNRGYVALREDTDEAKQYLADADKKNEAQKLLAEENADRKALYNETARVNGSPVTLSDVERVYARRRLERAQPGDIFQLPAAGEAFDAFKATDLGKKLGENCKAGAWVVIP